MKNENKNKNKNLKLYPKYRQLAMDLLFFYTINVLFLTQIKQIAISAVVLVDTFYALFVIICQIPGAIIVEKIGRKKSIILGNLCNAIYLIIVIILYPLIQKFGYSIENEYKGNKILTRYF